MARGPSKKPSPPKEIPTLKLWLEEAWHGWLKPVGAIALLLVAYLAYDRGLIPEGSAGLLAVAVIVGGAITSAGLPVFNTLERRQSKLLLGVFMAVWAVSAGYPSLRRAFPSKSISEPISVGYCARYRDAEKRECAEPVLSATAEVKGGGAPYEIAVSGELKGQGQAEASYRLLLTGADDSKDEVEGVLERTFFHQRTSRRGGGGATVKQEHTENSHRLTLHGSSIKVSTEGVDESLENGIALSIHPAGPDPRIFLGLAALCVLIGLLLDYRLAAPKVKTHFTVAAGLTLVFAWYYPTEATPHNLVRPAIAALIASLIGALGGWLLAVIVKSFKKMPKKG